MPSPRETPIAVTLLKTFALRHVSVKLHDGTLLAGTLRTELLSDRSISIFIKGDRPDGAGDATIYIDDIAAVEPGAADV